MNGTERVRRPKWSHGAGTFFRSHLSTSARLGETLCGLVTVLTFTLLASKQIVGGRAGVVQLLIATAGCCVTWGLIDGVLYVLDAISQRARRGRLARAVRERNDEHAFGLLREEVDEFLAELGVKDTDQQISQALRDSIAASRATTLHFEMEDWLGGAAIFSAQMLCCLPATLPFVLLDDPETALRISNGCSIALLFGVGFEWASEVGASRIGTALVVGALGVALVGVSIALNG